MDEAIKAASAYINLIRYSKDLQIVKMLENLYEIQVNVTEGLQKAGEVSQIDVNNSKASLINYQTQVKIIQDQVDSFKNQLLNTLYLKVCDLPTDNNLSIDFNFPTEATYDQDLKNYLELSPQIKEYENSILAYKNLEKSYTNKLIPSFKINLSVEADFDSGNISGNKNGEYVNSYESYVVSSLNWDIFNGGQDKANKISSSLKKQSYQNLLSEKKFNLKNDLKYKINRLKGLQEIFALAQNAIDILTDQVNMTNLGYESGFLSSLDFRNTATNYFSTAEKLTTTWSELLIEYLDYESGMLFPSFPKINEKLNNSSFNFKKLDQ